MDEINVDGLFTWEDVDALNDGAAEIDGEWTAPQPSAVALRSLADRIAALLPPREPVERLMGFPVVLDPSVPPGEVRFRAQPPRDP